MKLNFSIIFFLAFLIGVLFLWQEIYIPKDADYSELKIFVIKKREGTKEISLNLEKEGIIKSSPIFRFYALTRGMAGKLQAGGYLLSPAMTIPQITEKLFLGDVIKIELTIPEGFTIKQIKERLAENQNISRTVPDILEEKLIKDYKYQFSFLKDAPDSITLEGFLFPDTYYFSYETDIEEIIKKMLDNFDKKLTSDLREEIKSQNKTIFEMITMASLIEKEVQDFKDKQMVSGILWKRLENNIPLQVDATIAYILSDSEKYPQGHITGKKTTEISIEETKIDSLYNTYRYIGLPMGPISNPGLESILASVYPEYSDFWYYLSTPEGKTIFSRTLKEHNIAKAEYLK